jgi:phosphopantothenoylcysteine decarboxylase/phosphopantothenate--cysteine ligase
VAPATAHFLARLAWGLADELLTTTALACDCPVIAAPAMNTRMWENQATRDNVERLLARGVVLAGPGSGPLACGTSGDGRMLEPEAVLDVVLSVLEGRDRP